MSGISLRRGTAGPMRAGLGLLSLSALSVGSWALLLPRSFYEDFPLPGRGWVSSLGVLLSAAAVSLGRELVRASLVAWLVFAAPHFVYHMVTLHHYPLLIDRIGNAASLGLVIVLPLILLALGDPRRGPAEGTTRGAQSGEER